MEFNDTVSPIFRHAAERPEHPAFVFGEQVISYAVLEDEARRLATVLAEAGIVKGDRVAVFSPNRPEIFSVYLGMAMIGAAIVTINSEFAPHEVGYVLQHSQARMVVLGKQQVDLARQALDGVEAPPVLRDFDELLARAEDAASYRGPQLGSGEDLAFLAYTSGTTSKPKGVAATHANELASGFAYSGMWAMTPADRVLVTLPLSFSFGFHAAVFVSLISGATVLLAPRFHPQLALEAIESLKPTVFLGVPTMYAMMIDVARSKGRRYETSSLRLAAASGAALNEQVVSDCEKYLGFPVHPYYALTEVRPVFCFDLRQQDMPPRGSVGRLIPPSEARIVDESGNDVPAGQTGELWVRGPSFSGSYYRDPKRTAEAMAGDWFRTGDLAFCDDNGNYFIVGRNRDQIICGGAKIAPIEVEDALLAHPGVSAAAVVGSPDSTYGQLVKAVIVKSDPGLTEEDILQHCKGRVADYKIPRIVAFVEELPMSPSGKVLKSALV